MYCRPILTYVNSKSLIITLPIDQDCQTSRYALSFSELSSIFIGGLHEDKLCDTCFARNGTTDQPISKRLIKPPYYCTYKKSAKVSRAKNLIDSDDCVVAYYRTHRRHRHRSTVAVLIVFSNEANKSVLKLVLINKAMFLKATSCRYKENCSSEAHGGRGLEFVKISWRAS